MHCRLAPLASCNARVLCAVEIHVLELLDWAPLTLWDDARHSKGIPLGKWGSHPGLCEQIKAG